MFASMKAVFYTELLLQLRRSHEWLYPLGFFVIVVCLFPLAFTPDPSFLQKHVAGCIWIAALLASMLSIETVFTADLEDGELEQLLLSPMPLAFIMLAKLAAHWLVSALPLMLLTPLLGILFQLPLNTVMVLCLSLLLGTPILILIGSLMVALTLGMRQQGVMLGLLLLPLVTPVLIFGVNMVQQVQQGLSIVGPAAFLASLALFAITLLPWAIAATLRISVDD